MPSRPSSSPNLASLLQSEGIDPSDLWGGSGGAYAPPAMVRGVPELAGAFDALEQFASGGEVQGEDIADFYPLPDAELPLREWLAKVEPGFDFDSLAPAHEELIRWIEEIEESPDDVEPPAFLADWPRGYGKTTWLRLFLYRMCVTKKRRFALVTANLQASANRTVQKLREYFDKAGIKRRESLHGFSVSWNAEVLITACGFVIVAVGLDTANTRGINILGLRPDILAPDDMHAYGQSAELTQKNIQIFTNTILPTALDNAAILFVQNSIESHSLMYGLKTDEIDALRYKQVSFAIAVEGLQIGYKPNPIPGRRDLYSIVAGISTWPGKTIAYWERLLNRFGKQGFLREMQGELGAGGLFFNFFEEMMDPATGELLPWHVCDMPIIQPHWIVQAGGDYGTAAPHAQEIGVLDDWGVLYVVGEECEANRTSKQQALALLLGLEDCGLASGINGHIARRARPEEEIPGNIVALDRDKHEQAVTTRLGAFALDPAGTFPPEGNNAQTAQQRMSEYPVEVFWRYGIPVVRAQKDVKAGLANLRDGMDATVTYPMNHPTEPGRRVPMVRFVRGRAPMAQEYVKTAMKDPKDENLAVSAAKYEHSGDGIRYLVMRALEARDPNAPKVFVIKGGGNAPGRVIDESVAAWARKALEPYADYDQSEQVAGDWGRPTVERKYGTRR